MKKLRKEIKEFEKEQSKLKNERESQKDRDDIETMIQEIKRLKDLRFKEEKNNDQLVEKYKQELNDHTSDNFMIQNQIKNLEKD